MSSQVGLLKSHIFQLSTTLAHKIGKTRVIPSVLFCSFKKRRRHIEILDSRVRIVQVLEQDKAMVREDLHIHAKGRELFHPFGKLLIWHIHIQDHREGSVYALYVHCSSRILFWEQGVVPVALWMWL